MRLLWARGSAELGQIASGSAKQDLWLGVGKVGSQVIGEDQCRLPGRGATEKIRKEVAERRKENTDLEETSMSRGRNAGLTIFITSMSTSKSLTSFAYRFFHFRNPPGLG